MHWKKDKNRVGLRAAVYAGIAIEKDGFFVATRNGQTHSSVDFVKCKREDMEKKIFAWLHKYAIKNYVKIFGAGFVGEVPGEITSDVWLKQDIVPYVFDIESKLGKKKAISAAQEVAKKFGNDNIVDIKFDPERKVRTVRLARLEDFRKTASRADYEKLISLADKLKRLEGRILFFSSTPRGGGVALMRHALIRLFRLLDVDAHWYVLSSKKEFFNITKKKFHDVLQGVALKDTKFTESDKKIYEEWIGKNAKRFSEIFKKARVIVIDDPQPSGLIAYIKKINPYIKIIYRSHIQIKADLISRKESVQCRVWNYLWKNIKLADLFVSHPIEEFIPHNVLRNKTVLMGASTDKLDGLNKKLNKEQVDYYLDMFDDLLQKNKQRRLDRSRPFIIQIARFDPAKGIPDVLKSFLKLRKMMDGKKINAKFLPQLVITGHGSIDDPEAMAIFKDTLKTVKKEEYEAIKDDIKIIRLPHHDQILNALLTKSYCVLQLSHREGFEVKVSEALNKGKPVIAYRTGGIPLQVENYVNGYLVKIGDTSKVAKYLGELLGDKAKYSKMRQNSKDRVKQDCFTVSNAAKWLYLATELLEKGQLSGKRKYVRDLMKK